MGWVRMRVRVRSPPVMQSKLLCLSLLYLLTTLPLALYVSFSDPASAASRCLVFLPFRSSAPSSAASAALFEYPREYGEHKHAIPATRALCSDPAVFSDYKTVLEEINKFCRNLSASPYAKPALRYQNGRRNSFAGNLSTVERRSFFNHTDSAVEIPCGFFKEFPVRESDRLAMEKCNGVVVASAIFNDHDKIRQPKGLGSETLRTVCFFMFIDDATHRVLASHNILAGERGEAGTIGCSRTRGSASGWTPRCSSPSTRCCWCTRSSPGRVRTWRSPSTRSTSTPWRRRSRRRGGASGATWIPSGSRWRRTAGTACSHGPLSSFHIRQMCRTRRSSSGGTASPVISSPASFSTSWRRSTRATSSPSPMSGTR
ncbi:hypothetical protein DAI22_01g077800 [Oryza sativa Japonica Group]|nr:hypothetical protein DAI22_01g077800 [Oryza sativa Japonica Group]